MRSLPLPLRLIAARSILIENHIDHRVVPRVQRFSKERECYRKLARCNHIYAPSLLIFLFDILAKKINEMEKKLN